MTTPLRSMLFVPGTREDRFSSAITSGADAVVFDLEDSVEETRKAEARQAISRFQAASGDLGPPMLVRVNAFGSRWFHDDLQFAGRLPRLGGIVVPKAETVEALRVVAQVVGGDRVFPLLETARGVLNSAFLADAIPSVPALLFGAEDLTAEIGVRRTTDGEELLFARSQVVLAAAAAGAEAIDAVFTDVADGDGLRRDATRARALGFRGKMTIHPSQIAIVNEIFSPSAADIAQADKILSAYAAAQAAGSGVLRLGNEMVDAPVVARAQRVLDLASKLGKR
jgi:citrate lyase subunit beta / citryl-CoA lyase